jgi:GT2 family glycosyltransferase
MKIAIVILNWNGKKDTLECLASLRHLTYSNYEIIVVDNGSTDDSIEAIKLLHPEAHIIAKTKNLGFAGGCNFGMRYALEKGADAICLLNNDAVVDPLILSSFVERVQKDPTIGILGAQILMYSDRERLDHLGGRWNPSMARFDLVGCRKRINEFFWNEEDEIDYVCGAALFVKKEVIEKIGLLEEEFFLIWEEADFCFRAKRAGFKVKVCPTAKIYHKVSASFTCRAHSTYFFFRNRLFWMERNLPKQEYDTICKKILTPEKKKIQRHLLLRSLQCLIQRYFLRKPPSSAQKGKILQYKASLQGIRDFKDKRLGNGPAWIYKKNN